ncbi:MAG: class I SAM-dependent methyltransferase [Terriglobales bacterium]|jgi:predicted O-methyltransferase YrrM
MRRIKPIVLELLKNVSRKVFFLGDRVGIHILPKHYYTPVPDYTWLAENRQAWIGRSSMPGVHWDLDEQLGWLADICAPYYSEVGGLESFRNATSSGWGPGYGPIESQVLHCFVRRCAPARVIEIGSGVSTACVLNAVGRNRREGRAESQITCVEPYPSKMLLQLSGVTLLRQMSQTVPMGVFDQLAAGDLLFIDSTHAVKTGSDVMQLFLDILPRLARGVFVHIHDIYLPYVYPRNTMHRYFGWQETALLLALMVNNQKLKTLCCLSALHYDRTQQMRALLPDYLPQANDEGLEPAPSAPGHFPSSLWLQTA